MERGILNLKGLKQKVYLGVDDAERASAQEVEIDVVMNLDFTRCIRTDALSDTVDYLAIARSISALCSEYQWKLIERFAGDIAGQLLTKFYQIQSLAVTVHKRVPFERFGIPPVESFSATVHKERAVT